MTLCHLIVGVNLDREILAGIDELDEQGELITKPLVVLLADKLTFQFADELVKAFALMWTIGNDRLLVFDTREFPAFAYTLHLDIQVLEGDDPVTSPERLFQ